MKLKKMYFRAREVVEPDVMKKLQSIDGVSNVRQSSKAEDWQQGFDIVYEYKGNIIHADVKDEIEVNRGKGTYSISKHEYEEIKSGKSTEQCDGHQIICKEYDKDGKDTGKYYIFKSLDVLPFCTEKDRYWLFDMNKALTSNIKKRII